MKWFKKLSIKRTLAGFGILLGVGLVLAACGHPTTTSASDRARQGNAALQTHVYNVHNNVEFNNYNRRQAIADDPTTILWCTAYPMNLNAKPITVPIVGKLTSSNKRPYATSQVVYQNDYNPEIPGPDKMYGSSTEYRYGFTPGGVYFDFTGLETICTTQPTVYQATQTSITLTVDPALAAVQAQAQAALKAGQKANGTIDSSAGDKAQQLLQNATGGH